MIVPQKVAKRYQVYKAILKEINQQASADIEELAQIEEMSDELTDFYEILSMIEYQSDDLLQDIQTLTKMKIMDNKKE